MSEVGAFAKGLSDTISQYLGYQTQMAMQQQMEERQFNRQQQAQMAQEERQLENQKKLKVYDFQLDDLRDMKKNERETVPFSIFQGKGIPEADQFRPDDRVKISDAINFFKEKSKDKSAGSNTVINSLRGDYLQQSKAFADTAQSTQRILDSAKDPSPAGDLALIFNFMKVLDPGSTVREGEFATAQNSAGIPEQIRAQYNKVLKGERLSPNTRNDFVTRAKALYKGQEQLHQQRIKSFRYLAQQQNVDPEAVILALPTPNITDEADPFAGWTITEGK